ncbi:DnaJ (Hsp40), sub C, member 17 [Chytriomyces hyalinus]|nr:DnaJ (Hsp40), sub C, member 17 [Chytriomyces hyalinus]
MEPHNDLYELLGVPVTATSQQISKAYRKKALKVHPDKVGPDNEAAAAQFLQLTHAVDTLTDAAKRAAYDNLHKAHVAKRERVEKLDEARKKAKRDLEERETRGAQLYGQSNDSFNEAEVKRLREEGLKRLAEMMKEDELEREARDVASNANSTTNDLDHSISLKWKAGQVKLTEDQIETLFSAFGEIDVLRVKKKSALLVYKNASDAEKIYNKRDSFKDYEIDWLTPRTKKTAEPAIVENDIATAAAVGSKTAKDKTSGFSFSIGSPSSKFESIENDTLRRMREREKARSEAMLNK